MPQRIGLFDKAGTCDTYELRLGKKLKDLIGLLIVDWGKGERAWVQYADRQDKSILEIAGSAQTHDEILAMEGRWQRKLQSREMGLNQNIAKKV